MQVICEHDMVNVKKKMTEIRRNRQGRVIHQNYYGNCDQNEETFVIYGNNTVVIWEYDHDVIRGYFCSSEESELAELLQYLPKGCIIDYLTKEKGDMQEFLEAHGFLLLHEMHRMSSSKLTEEEKKTIAENCAILQESLYRPENVRAATISDLEAVYKKLYEVFDSREAHLPTKLELKKLIENQWVAVYYEHGTLLGIEIFTADHEQKYGYLDWNGAGPEGYYSLIQMTAKLYSDYLKRNHIELQKVNPGYCWVNAKNRKAKRLIEFWGSKFDGLYDFVYEKQ